MKIASYDIVFQEIPGEVTLALNISGCPNRCPGCHSPHLREDIGEELTDELLDALINQYRTGITCVCFMGGDQDPDEVARLAAHVRAQGLKTAWYSGKNPTTREPLPASPQGEVNRWGRGTWRPEEPDYQPAFLSPRRQHLARRDLPLPAKTKPPGPLKGG